MKYRADIDGLRTIAVLPVVLFHAATPGMSGGFVGVDVFFVISGFLITKLILSDIEGKGFSITNFYDRRIRRIFPALITVLLFCFLAAYLIYPPLEYIKFGRSVAPVTLFFSNFFFWKSANYFDPSSDLNPLLHTWSLSVEEQFYIFYPLLLIALHRWRWPIRSVLVIIGTISLILASLLVYVKPSATFYLLPTRTWELMIGGIVALWPYSDARPYRLNLLASVLGLIFILAPIVFYSKSTSFPGITAIPPVLGAALIIWSGTGIRQTAIHRVLSSRPMVFVGVSSYSLYLWHFPLLAFISYVYGGRAPLIVALLTCLVAFGMALLSLHLIERPVRRRSTSARARATVVVVPVVMMVMITIAGIGLARSTGLPERLDVRTARMLTVTGDKTRHHAECMSNGDVIVPPSKACLLGTAGAMPNVLLWGDSHAMVTATAMDVEARRYGAALLFAASADCPIGLGFAISDTTERGLTTTPSYRYCTHYNAAMLERALADAKITSVVLSSRWTNWRIGESANPAESRVDLRLSDAHGIAPSMLANREIFERGFTALLRRLTAANKRVFIVAPVPEPSVDVPQALYVQRFGLVTPLKDLSLDGYRQRHATILTFFARIHLAMPEVQFIQPTSILCDRTGRCPVSYNGVPVFFDHNHLSVDAARRTASLYAPVFQP
jgi:peptidoglycan/LPS O-acetylase OafA/YrhL